MAENDSEKSSKETEAQPNAPRQELLNTAIKFLQNPNVQKSSLVHQQAFLKSKGLTEEEVKIACERSAALTAEKYRHIQTTVANLPPLPPPYVETPWIKFRDAANTIIVIGGISYGLFLLYKRFIVPLLFGEPKKKKSVEQSVAEIDLALARSVQELRESLNKVHTELKALQEQQKIQTSSESSATAKQVDELKAEVVSVKGLLLNRNQFAPPITAAPLSPPSIPAWQLTAAAEAKDAEEGPQGSKGDADIEEICTSGSGSSETEMVTNNGSDSSLEMIRE